jgi:(p)ppGpp synthase/HD superfamily hydrolase
MMNLIARATLFADQAHDGQLRKFSGLPYISHPMEVMQIVRGVCNDDDVLAAAVLHDVIEDCGVTYTDLMLEFNENIAHLVYQVTNAANDEDGDRIVRAYINRNVMANASDDAQTLKLADIISNLSGIDLALECDPAWAKMYLEEKVDMINVLTRGDATLKKRAASLAAEGILKCSMR